LLQLLAKESFVVESVEERGELVSKLEASMPRAILLSPSLPNPSEVCLAVRMHARFSMVPILWVQDDLDDLVFGDAFGVGGDDAVQSANHDGMIRRLKMLPEPQEDTTGAGRGVALIGEADDDRRIVLARLFRNAGFDVSFAGNVEELSERVRSAPLVLVVADLELSGGGTLACFSGMRGEGSKVPWVLATPPKKLRETSDALKHEAGAWVWDSYAPPENVLYAANEALRGSFAEQRASPRLLYGTAVAFRQAGRDRDDVGFLYNVSGEGLFIRTLAPLGSGEDAWLEFKPPRTDRRVRLEAKVVWRKQYGRVSEATVPPGFGVKISGGSTTDMKRYRDGYRALAEQFAGIRFSKHPSAIPGSGD
jgi:DNA-binding response OmpR family regulator/Tfp pilus assembly protein PilZ